MKLIDKDTLVAELERLYELEYIKSDNLSIGKKMMLRYIRSFIDTIEVKEVSEELSETYIQVFEKKFPILPTLKGKQLDKFKNFLNRCRQIFGLQEFGIRPVQAKLFEKLALLWAAWGAENLQGIGQVKGEPDVVKEVDLEKEIKDTCRGYRINESHEQELGKRDIENIAKYFFELGFKTKKGE